jgi:hypothetical protein
MAHRRIAIEVGLTLAAWLIFLAVPLYAIGLVLLLLTLRPSATQLRPVVDAAAQPVAAPEMLPKYPVDGFAADDVKRIGWTLRNRSGSGCPSGNCPTTARPAASSRPPIIRPRLLRPVVPQPAPRIIPTPDAQPAPTVPTQPAATPTKPKKTPQQQLGERKNGTWACAKCGRRMTGDEIATDWSADGQPISFLCRGCHSATPAAQRVELMQAWLDRQGAKISAATLIDWQIAVAAN